MDSESDISRGPAASLSFSSRPHSVHLQNLSNLTPPFSISPLLSVITCEGKAKVIWPLPPCLAIPVLPRMVPATQLWSQRFFTGDGHVWTLRACQNREKTHVAVYIRKEEVPTTSLEDYKAKVVFKLFSGESAEEFDAINKTFKFNVCTVMHGYEHCFEVQGHHREPFYVEVTITPAQNNEKSREQTQFVGLKNEGNTCYINALLQTLYHLPSLRHAVFHIPSTPARSNLAFCLQKVLYDLQISPESVSARHLMDCLEVAENEGQQDVHEFSLKFLEKLEASMSSSATSDFIQWLLKGRTRTIVECTEIDHKGEPQIEEFLDLQLSVSDAGNVHESMRKLTYERLTGADQFDAGVFGKQNAVRKVKFQRLPPVLQFYLKRFQYFGGGIEKVNSKFEFPENLDLAEYLEQPGEAEYRLFAILVHKGVSQQGHYFAFVKTNLSEWFKFNDKSVDKVTAEQVFRSSFGGNMKDLKVGLQGVEECVVENDTSAYMLCYVKKAETHTLFNPQVSVPQELEGLLLQDMPEAVPYVEIPKRNRNTFQLAIVTIDHLQGHTGPGLLSSIEAATWLEVPAHYSARDLLLSFARENNERKQRLWLLTAAKPVWRFGTLQDSCNLQELIRDKGKIVFVEVENNATLICNGLLSDILDLGGAPQSKESLPFDLSPPLRQPNQTLVFLKLFQTHLGSHDLILKSAANLTSNRVSVASVLAYMSLLTFGTTERAARARLAVEHCGVDGDFTCKTVNTGYIGTRREEGTVIVANGDALIVEFDALWSGIPAEEYYTKLLHYTEVRFEVVREPRQGESELDRTMKANGNFSDWLRSDSRLLEVQLYLCKRFAEAFPVLSSSQFTFYYQSATSQFTPFPQPVSESHPANLLLSQLAPNNQLFYSLTQAHDLELSVLYVNSAQEPVFPHMKRTLAAHTTVKDLIEALSEEVKQRLRKEQQDFTDLKVVIYEHDARTRAYLRALQGDYALRGCDELSLSVKAFTALEKNLYRAGAKRVDVIVICASAYLFPKYILIPVFPTQLNATCRQVMDQIVYCFAPSPVTSVGICNGKAPFDRLEALESSEQVFWERHQGIQLCVELKGN